MLNFTSEKVKSFESALKYDFRVAMRMIRTPDFEQGIKYLTGEIEKPIWSKTEVNVENLINEPLTLEKDGCCDLNLPDEIFNQDLIEDFIVNNKNKIEIKN